MAAFLLKVVCCLPDHGKYQILYNFGRFLHKDKKDLKFQSKQNSESLTRTTASISVKNYSYKLL